MQKIYLLVFFVLAAFTGFAQQNRKLTGKITDQQNGETLIGVSVGIKGSSIGTTTDVNGLFTINIPTAKPTTLIIRYLGYQPKEVVVDKQSNLEITLVSDNQSLNEVVVIGYGEVARKDLTGSVGTVKIEDLQKAPVRSFEEALAGRVAGVQVTSDTGQPGAGSTIVIRGANSLTQDNSPLWVVDGFILENPDNNAINPSEIESMEVLKDASATAIYGARGANGVIIVTTKSGKIGEPKITFDTYYGIQNKPGSVEVLSPYEFVKLQSEIDPISVATSYLSNGKTLDSYKTEAGVNWQDQILRSAPINNYNLALSGGTKKTKYFISGNLFNQKGVLINSAFERKQLRVRLDQDVNDRVKVGINLGYNNNIASGATPSSPESNFVAQNYLLYSVWGYRPTNGGDNQNLLDNLIDPEIDPVVDYRVNPVFSAQNELRETHTNNLSLNGYGEFQFTKNLKLRVTGAINNRSDRRDVFNNSKTRYGNPGSRDKVNGSITNTEINNWLNENTLSYNKKFGKNHTVSAVAGVTMQETTNKIYGLSAINLPNESLGLSGLDEGLPIPVTSSTSQNGLFSYLGRVNYNYKSKYLLTASFRSDGSSKFRGDNRYSYFPSAAFAWRAINEDFLKDVSFLSDAKVRVGYGITGNNRVPDYATYARLSFLNFSNANGYYAFNNTLTQGVYSAALENAELKWESTSQANIGFDLGFFQQRLTLTADYYNKETYDLLLNANLPSTTGYTSAFKNIGKTRNEGLEFTLNTVNIDKKNFGWNTSFSIAFNKNKVLALTENQESILSTVNWDQFYRSLPGYIAKIGEPIGQMYGFIWDGLYQTSDFDLLPNGTYLLKDLVPTNGNARANIQPGDIKYQDINGDGVVDNNDRTVIGRAYPIHTGGLSNNFRYKGFDLSVFFQWSYGNDIINANRLQFENGGVARNVNQFATFANRWTPTNTETDIPRLRGQGPVAYSSRVVEDGSFLRFKTLSLGYNLPKGLLKKAKISSLRVYASAQNLYTISNYSGYDPEVAAYNSPLTPGFDYSVYPRANTMVFGLNVTL